MSGREENNTRAQKPLASLPTETLEDMLRWYALSDADVGEERISEIISELRSREKNEPLEPDVDRALRDFFEIYSDEDVSSETVSLPGESKSARPRRSRKVRVIAALAAVIALLLATTVIAGAAGVDVFRAVANWAGETFKIEYERSYEHSGAQDSAGIGTGYAGITDIVEEYGRSGIEEPKWLPDGFGEPVIEADELGTRLIVTATYTRGEDFINITAAELGDPPIGMIYETDSEFKMEYTHNGIKFYAMSNYDVTTVVWNSGGFECSVISNISRETLKQVIDSV